LGLKKISYGFFGLCQSVSTHIKKLFLGYLLALLSSNLKM